MLPNKNFGNIFKAGLSLGGTRRGQEGLAQTYPAGPLANTQASSWQSPSQTTAAAPAHFSYSAPAAKPVNCKECLNKCKDKCGQKSVAFPVVGNPSCRVVTAGHDCYECASCCQDKYSDYGWNDCHTAYDRDHR
eukprot:g14183.t1